MKESKDLSALKIFTHMLFENTEDNKFNILLEHMTLMENTHKILDILITLEESQIDKFEHLLKYFNSELDYFIKMNNIDIEDKK